MQCNFAEKIIGTMMHCAKIQKMPT